MSVDINQIRNTATLARLSFSDSELEALKDDFDTILEYMDVVSRFDCRREKPAISGRSTQLRTDQCKESLQVKDALRNAPNSDGVFFRVPRVIDN